MVAFFFFGVVDGVGHCGGCGYFFFFGCDRCLKGLWVVVGSSVWVMVGSGVWVVVEVGWVRYLGLVLWLKWVGSGVWVMVGSVGWDWLMVGLKQWIC